MLNGNPFVYTRSEAIRRAKRLAKKKDCEVFVLVSYPNEYYYSSDSRFVYAGYDEIECIILSDGTIEIE